MKREGIALECGGVVNFLVPNRSPNIFSLERRWKATHALTEFSNGLAKPLINGFTARTASM